MSGGERKTPAWGCSKQSHSVLTYPSPAVTDISPEPDFTFEWLESLRESSKNQKFSSKYGE